MTSYNRNTSLILAFLTIPFGIAIYQDATGKTPRNDPFADSFGLYGNGYDDYDYDDYAYEDYDYDEYPSGDELDQLLAELERDDYAYDDYDDFEEEEEVEAMSADFFKTVVFDGGRAKGPVLAGPLGKLEMGAVVADQLARTPALEGMIVDGIPGFESAKLSMQPDYTGRLISAVLYFPDDGSASTSLQAQWGSAHYRGPDDGQYWFNAKSKVAAMYNHSPYGDEASIIYSRFQSLEDLIQPKKKLFSFEEKDLLDAESGSLPASIYNDGYGGELAIPFVRGSHVGQGVSYDFGEESKVSEISFELSMYKDGDQVLPLFRKKYGKESSVEDDGYSSTHIFKDKKGRTVELTKSGYDDRFEVSIHR